jgi:mRNA interferase RelE/StbE
LKIQISLRAQKQLRKIPKTNRDRIIKAAESLMHNPDVGKRLTGKLGQYRSLRVGDYRVIYETESDTIKIDAIGHRKHVYELIRRIMNFLFGL